MDLIFPQYNAKVIKRNGKPYIFDIIRKKYVFLTPEEWIRQHCINYMVDHKNYPKSLISVERGHKINSRQKRSDLVVYNNTGNAEVLIEFKAPDVPINQMVLQQISQYNQTINARVMIVTNGIDLLTAIFKNNEMVYSNVIPEYHASE